MVDVKVVPDLLQVIALRARLEDLDGVPVININDVPLQGLNSAIKRALDIAISAAALAVLSLPLLIIAILVQGDVARAECSTGRNGWASTASRSRSSSSARCSTTPSATPARCGRVRTTRA